MSKVMITVTTSTGETQRLWVTLADVQETFTVTVVESGQPVSHRYDAGGQMIIPRLRTPFRVHHSYRAS